MPRWAVDTSVAVPLLVASHEAHPAVASWASGRTLALSGHALAETYSVLTRLPGDARVVPADAAVLIEENFEECLALPTVRLRAVHRELARYAVAGGAVYDALVALAALEHGAVLATRDARALATYVAVGAQVEVVADAGPAG